MLLDTFFSRDDQNHNNEKSNVEVEKTLAQRSCAEVRDDECDLPELDTLKGSNIAASISSSRDEVRAKSRQTNQQVIERHCE